MKVAAPLFHESSPVHPGLNTPILSVYVPGARFVGTVHVRLNVRVTFAVKERLSQYVW